MTNASPRETHPLPRHPALSWAAKTWLVALALVLMVPTAAMQLQSDEALEAFHNRVLTPWPTMRRFGRDPAGWFATANRWLADRIYPIIGATHLANTLAYFVLDSAPKPNVSVTWGGFVFLNGNDPSYPNNLVENACAEPLDAGFQTSLRAALHRIASFGRRRGLPVDVVVVPTAPTLYPEKLPRAIPSRLRQACLQASRGGSPFFDLQKTAGLTFVYPYAAMQARRSDPAMFPNGNYHPDGLSVQIVRDAYLDATGAARPADETVTLTSGLSEILGSHGIPASFPLYEVSPPTERIDDEETAAAIRDTTARFYGDPQTVFVSRNPQSPNPSTVLMLSDSYGVREAFSFSAAFRTVVQMNAPEGDITPVVEAVQSITGVDRLVLLFNDGNAGSLIQIADTLPADATPANAR